MPDVTSGRAGLPGQGTFLACAGLSKSYPGVQALAGVDLGIEAGTIHALVGENGAGKSTFVEILAGAVRPDAGEMLLDGRPYAPSDAAGARASGVSVVHQELSLVPPLTVAENIALGHLPTSRGQVDWASVERRAVHSLRELGSGISPRAEVRRLTVAQRQLVEIAKALTVNARLLVLDEPSASLSDSDARALHELVRRLARQGIAILYVSHRLDEVLGLSDRITVFRDGRLVSTLERGQADRAGLVRLMAGKDLPRPAASVAREAGKVRLAAEDIRHGSRVVGVSLELRAGEVVGLFGLVGAGRTELARCLFGADPHEGGTVRVDGQVVPPGSILAAVRAGIAYLPEDRKDEGLVLRSSVAQNISLANLSRLARAGIVSRRKERALATESVARFRIRTPSIDQPAVFLSGGNQQKVVLAKWLATRPKVLLLDEPTKGIDVRAKAEIHEIIRDLAQSGVAVLVISSELEEVLHLADRVVVMHEGRIRGQLQAGEATEARVLDLATGGHGAAAEVVPIPPGSPAHAPLALPELAEAIAAGEQAPAGPGTVPGGPAWGSLGRRLVVGNGAVIGLLGVVAVASILSPVFISVANVGNLLQVVTVSGLLAVGMGYLLLNGAFDLSVGATFALAGIVFIVAEPLGAPVAFGLALLAGCLVGLLNGVLTALGANPLVLTIGIQSALMGGMLLVTNAAFYTGSSPATTVVGRASLGGLPIAVIVLAAVTLGLELLLRRTIIGRYVYAAGRQLSAARMSGVPVTRTIIHAFVFTGLITALAGVVQASRLNSAKATAGTGLEFTALTAAIVGGIGLFGGEGNVLRGVIGAAVLAAVANIMVLLNAPFSSQLVAQGAIFLAVVGIDRLTSRGTRT